MSTMILTNNAKVAGSFKGTNQVEYLEGAAPQEVLKAGKSYAEKGCRLLLDPSRRKNYYKSLVFLMEETGSPDHMSLDNLSRALAAFGGGSLSKEPILAGIHQNRDLDVIRQILG